jgi:uncharacterized membrane protein YkoI
MQKNRIRTALIAGAAVVGVGLGGFGIAAAGSNSGSAPDKAEDAEEHDTPIAERDLDQASAAALAHTGEGRVTETEVGDEESYYEVEVTLDDGSQVDVQLDESFNVVGSETDDETEAE